MAKGGFTGAVPPRETSPEEYSGVWDITEQYGEQKTGSWPFQKDDCAPKSLKFDGTSTNLEKTFVASGNRTTWTWSCWLKRGRMDLGRQVVFGAYDAANDDTWLEFGLDNSNAYYTTNSIAGASNAAFRDPTAFYHYFANFDGTTFKIFVNNEEVLSSTSLAGTRGISGPYRHRIGQSPASHTGNIRYFDGVMAECHFIDGQVLSPSDFAFYDGAGIWQPKRFTGDYSSGPVYSNSAVISSGGSNSSYPLYQGFNGDLSNRFEGDTTDAYVDIPYEATVSSGSVEVYVAVTSSQPVVVTLFNGSSQVATGSSGASGLQWHAPTTYAGPITKIRIARTGRPPEFNAVRVNGAILTDAAVGRNSFHLDFSSGAKDQSGLGNDWTTNGLVFTTGSAPSYSVTSGSFNTSYPVTNAFDGDLTTFVLASSSSAVITFSPAITGSTFRIYMAANNAYEFKINGTAPSNTLPPLASPDWVDFSSHINGTLTSIEIGRLVYYGSFYQVMYAIEVDGEILSAAPSDLCVDSPVNGNETSTGAGGERRGNYATLSPLTGAQTLSNGNLDVTGGSSWQRSVSTIAMSSGKWYWEYEITASNEHLVGVGPLDMQMSGNLGAGSPPGSGYGTELGFVNGTGANSAWTNTGQSTTGDLIGVAFDADAGNMYIYKNGTALNNGIPSHTGLINGPYYAVFSLNGSSRSGSVNFGQRRFKYQNAGTNRPSADYKPLATSFLPEPTIKRGDEAMDVALWTGNNSTNKIGNLRLSPDLVWIKARSPYALNHELYDIVRGASNLLRSNTAGAAANATRFHSFDSDGFTLNGSQPVNGLNETHVGWVWDAGDSTTTIAAGSLNNSAYDQSQNWSSYGDTNDKTNEAWEDIFDGNGVKTPHMVAQSSQTAVWTPSTPISFTKLELYANNDGQGDITLNGSISTTGVIPAGGGANIGWADVTHLFTTKSLSSIEVPNSYNTDPTRLGAIRIDGKILADSNITVTNVPVVATDVRARTDAGFSIAKWSKSANNQSYAHGLSQAPEFIIAKSVDGAHSWRVWHKDLAKNKNLLLDTNNEGETTYTDMIDLPGLYDVPLIGGGPGSTNGEMIAYNFHSVEGYCKVGSWSTDSQAVVYTGFRPKFLLYRYSSHAGNWAIFDTERDTSNPTSPYLFANSSAVEASQGNFDFLSNGFKLKVSLPTGRTVAYICFAENPFASNCRAR